MARGPLKYNVVFRAKAQREAMDALEFIAEQAGLDVALAWYAGLEAVIDGLSEMPLRFPLARENGLFPEAELRQALYKSHRLIFTIRKRTVHVLHVRHVAQNRLDDLNG